MINKKTRQSLGRGLDALFNEVSNEQSIEQVDDTLNTSNGDQTINGLNYIPIENLMPSSLQPRKFFDDTKLNELASSIKEKGLLQPLLVREKENGKYEIIAGERRWRASQIASLHQIPVVVKNLNDTEVLEVALIENLQRADHSPIEEAEGYQRLVDEFGHTQKDISELVSKSRSHIANIIRLLSLPKEIKNYLDSGEITMGHARALIGFDNPILIAKKIIQQGLSVRSVEKMITRINTKTNYNLNSNDVKKDINTIEIEKRLEDSLGIKVDILFDGKGGKLTFYYTDLEQLDDLVTSVIKRKV